jgi:hypothetical protein
MMLFIILIFIANCCWQFDNLICIILYNHSKMFHHHFLHPLMLLVVNLKVWNIQWLVAIDIYNKHMLWCKTLPLLKCDLHIWSLKLCLWANEISYIKYIYIRVYLTDQSFFYNLIKSSESLYILNYPQSILQLSLIISKIIL